MYAVPHTDEKFLVEKFNGAEWVLLHRCEQYNQALKLMQELVAFHPKMEIRLIEIKQYHSGGTW